MSDSNERTAMLAKMETLADDVIALEALARELAKAIGELSDQIGSDALQTMVRRKRVQALERRGQLAALRDEYAVRFGLDP